MIASGLNAAAPHPDNVAGIAWFAVRVKPNHERSVAAMLREKGFEEFLPLFQSRRKWSDRTKVMDAPLFPGYLFCRLNVNCRISVLSTPGVLYLVGIGKTATPVDEQEINALQLLVRSGLPVIRSSTMVVGKRVRLEKGPLRGVEGVIVQVRRGYQIFVSVTLLQRCVSVEVDSDSLSFIDRIPAAVS